MCKWSAGEPTLAVWLTHLDELLEGRSHRSQMANCLEWGRGRGRGRFNWQPRCSTLRSRGPSLSVTTRARSRPSEVFVEAER